MIKYFQGKKLISGLLIVMIFLGITPLNANNAYDSNSLNIELMKAIECEDIDAVKLLVNSGANINAIMTTADNQKKCPIIPALRYPKILEYLIDSGADVNIKLSQRKTPLHYASEYVGNYAYLYARKYDAVNILLKNGAEVNSKDLYGKTPLHSGILHKEIAITLIDNGADLYAVDNKGWKPLHHAYMQCDLDLLKALIEKGATLDEFAPDGGNALHYACLYRTYDKFSKLKMLRFLIEEENMNINKHSRWADGKDGAMTPLM